jgi:hypothetical protein
MRLRFSRRSIVIVLVVIGLLVAAGVALLLRSAEDIFANIRMADCAWGANVVVWNDADRDGQRDDDEAPLPDVAVHADDVRNTIVKAASAVTDSSGAAALSVFIAGCPETAFEVYAEAPTAMCATTPERLSSAPHAFGFASC